jgi:hypothetical protein
MNELQKTIVMRLQVMRYYSECCMGQSSDHLIPNHARQRIEVFKLAEKAGIINQWKRNRRRRRGGSV